MKLNELKEKLTQELIPCSAEEAEFEALCIVSDLLGIGNSAVRLHYHDFVTAETQAKAAEIVSRRLSGEPLQYILGKWEFYSNSFFVGKGVLIPRPETELLVDFAVENGKNKANFKCLDLCAGSGCIGISVAKALPASQVTLLEKSDEAFGYLLKNIEYNRALNATAFKGDIFSDYTEFAQADLILSNPPYIRSEVLPSLQKEVKQEPMMALDGGADGLDFYRAIAEKWVDCLKPQGLLAVEIGEDQGQAVAELFSAKFRKVEVIKDYSGLDRVVTACFKK